MVVGTLGSNHYTGTRNAGLAIALVVPNIPQTDLDKRNTSQTFPSCLWDCAYIYIYMRMPQDRVPSTECHSQACRLAGPWLCSILRGVTRYCLYKASARAGLRYAIEPFAIRAGK